MIEIRRMSTPNQVKRLDKNGKLWSVPDVFVMHTAEGSYNGTIGWEQNPGSGVSSHFVIAKDGRVTQLVPIEMAAFTQGLNYNWTNQPPMPKQATSKLVQERAVNPNCYCVSVEFEGFYQEHHGRMTEAQIASVVEVIRWCNAHGAKIPYDREHIIGHCEINPLYRGCCPGELFPYEEVLVRLQQETGAKECARCRELEGKLQQIQEILQN